MFFGERQIRRSESCEEWVEVGDLLASQGCGNVQAFTAAKGPVWALGPVTAMVFIDVLHSSYHLR